MNYQIESCKMEELKKRLANVEKKCRTYGCEFKFTYGNPYFENIKLKNGAEISVEFVDVEVSGLAIIKGWQWICEIEHTEGGNIVRGSDNIPEYYYTAPGKCDHCGTNHKRRYTYLVQNTETGEFKQVGKACLKDYTGISAEGVAAILSGYNIAGEFNGSFEECEGYKEPKFFNTAQALSVAIEEIKRNGYSKTFIDDMPNYASTKNRVMNILCGVSELKGFCVDDNLPGAMKMIDYCKSLNGNNSYVNNVKTICNNERVSVKDLGYLVSIPPMYEREMERIRKQEEESKKNGDSGYVGTVGERLVLADCDIKMLTRFDGVYGETYIYGIYNAGNVFTWKTSKYLPLDNRRKVNIKGTVKGHNEYRGTKQTELTRCSVK